MEKITKSTSPSPEQRRTRTDRTETEKRFTENTPLVYWLVNRYFPSLSGDDDILQEAMIGLWKACTHFDEEKGCVFATFATACVLNAVKMELRRRSQQIPTFSIDEPLSNDGFTVADLVEDRRARIEDSEILLREYLSHLTGRDRIAVEYRMLGLDQKSIGKKIGVSQAQCSRIFTKLRKEYQLEWRL